MTEKLQLSVGYQLPERYSIVEVIETYRDAVAEVYFPWFGMPDGRGVSVRYEADQYLMEKELLQLRNMGVKLHLLLNANCYGKDALSEKFAETLEAILSFLTEKFDLSGVTTTSLFVAKVCKKKFPALEVRASVNMNIASRQAMAYVTDYFDGFYVASLHTQRGESSTRLVKALKECQISDSLIKSYETVNEALTECVKDAKDDDEIIVLGSFVTVSEVVDCLVDDNFIKKARNRQNNS